MIYPFRPDEIEPTSAYPFGIIYRPKIPIRIGVGDFGEVTMELRQKGRSYVWSAKVAFLPDPNDPSPEEQARVVLGHTSFFRFFRARFDFQRNRVKLKANSLFVGRPG